MTTLATTGALLAAGTGHGVAPAMGLLLLGAYFLPTVIAGARGHGNGAAIFLVNLLLGWTVLGWIGALVWSVANSSTRAS